MTCVKRFEGLIAALAFYSVYFVFQLVVLLLLLLAFFVSVI